MSKIEELTLSTYPAVLFLILFLFSNSLGWIWPDGSPPLLTKQIIKGINLLALLVYCGSIVFVLAKRPLSSYLRVDVAILISILVICLSSSLYSNSTHYSYFLYPLLWTILLIRTAVLPACKNGTRLVFAVIFVFILAQAIVLFAQIYSATHMIIVKEHDGLFYRVLPTFPTNFERHYMGYLGMLLALYAYFKKNAVWALIGTVGSMAVIFCDNRSAILSLTLSLLLFSVIGFKFTLGGVVIRIFATLGFLFVLAIGVPKILNYPIGPSSIKNTEVVDAAEQIEKTTLPAKSSGASVEAETGDTSVNLEKGFPVGVRIKASKDTQNIGKLHEHLKPQLDGRSYHSYFEDTGGRFSIWKAAIKRIFEKPLLGNGHLASQSTEVISGMNSPYSSINTLYHNSFLQVGVDYGIPVLFMWMTILAIFFLRTTPICKTIIFAHCCHFSFQNQFLVGETSFFIIFLSILLPALNSESLRQNSNRLSPKHT